MIIGTILESSIDSASQNAGTNGASMIHFYTWSDAITWAEVQSERMVYASTGQVISTLCTIINTDTGQKRWWWAGVEYTG
mgnify:CR=1 FL=1